MHVRRRGSCVNLFKVRYYFVHIIKSPNLGILGNQMLNIACWEKVLYMLKLLNVTTSDEISNTPPSGGDTDPLGRHLWLKLYCLKFNFQSSQARDLCLDSNGANHFYNGVGVHDPVRTIKMRCINNINIKGMSEQPKEIIILNTRETTVSTKDSNVYVGGSTNKSVPGMEYNDFNRS